MNIDELQAGRKTVLTLIKRQSFGAPTPEILAHDEIARRHFVKYCEKCSVAADLKTWHEGPCTECYENPYIMIDTAGVS